MLLDTPSQSPKAPGAAGAPTAERHPRRHSPAARGRRGRRSVGGTARRESDSGRTVLAQLLIANEIRTRAARLFPLNCVSQVCEVCVAQQTSMIETYTEPAAIDRHCHPNRRNASVAQSEFASTRHPGPAKRRVRTSDSRSSSEGRSERPPRFAAAAPEEAGRSGRRFSHDREPSWTSSKAAIGCEETMLARFAMRIPQPARR
jgi:hypothetical protein